MAVAYAPQADVFKTKLVAALIELLRGSPHAEKVSFDELRVRMMERLLAWQPGQTFELEFAYHHLMSRGIPQDDLDELFIVFIHITPNLGIDLLEPRALASITPVAKAKIAQTYRQRLTAKAAEQVAANRAAAERAQQDAIRAAQAKDARTATTRITSAKRRRGQTGKLVLAVALFAVAGVTAVYFTVLRQPAAARFLDKGKFGCVRATEVREALICSVDASFVALAPEARHAKEQTTRAAARKAGFKDVYFVGPDNKPLDAP